MSRIGDGAPAPAALATLDTQVAAGPVTAAATATATATATAGGATATATATAGGQVQADVFQQQAQGIMPGGCFPPMPQPLPFPMPFPLPEPMPLPHPMPGPFPMPPAPRDAGADTALNQLNQQKGPISGEDFAKAIKSGTEDLDGQAAGLEYKQFSDWANQNKGKLSPEAQEVMKVYDKYATQSLANGQTGISQADYQKMLQEMKTVGSTDVSAKQAIDGLSKGDGKISGEDMTRSIEKGTSDLDSSSATKEFDQFAKFAQQNPGRLSPEAQQVMDIYKKYANEAKAGGQTGISQANYDKMLAEMKQVKTYKDESAGQALDNLNHVKSPVSGGQMLNAIKTGTADTDGQAAGKELQDLIAWARNNASRLGPDAKAVVAIYMKYATQSVVNGQTGIPQSDYNKMLKEMQAALLPVIRPMTAGPLAG